MGSFDVYLSSISFAGTFLALHQVLVSNKKSFLRYTLGRSNSKILLDDGDGSKADETILDIVSSLTSILLCAGYAASMYLLQNDIFLGTCSMSRLTLSLHGVNYFPNFELIYTSTHSFVHTSLFQGGYTLYGSVIATQYSREIGTTRVIYAHHLITLCGLILVLHVERGHFFGAWVGLCEGTNPFLSALYTLRRLGKKDGFLAVVCGFGLSLGFLVLRVLSLALCVSSLVKGVPLARELGLEKAIWGGCAVILVLWALSTFWFVLMVKGLVKLIKKRQRMASN